MKPPIYNIMYPYVVCFCGCPIGHLWPAFVLMRAMENEKMYSAMATPIDPSMIEIASDATAPLGAVLDQLCIKSECCRRAMLTQVEFNNMPPTM